MRVGQPSPIRAYSLASVRVVALAATALPINQVISSVLARAQASRRGGPRAKMEEFQVKHRNSVAYAYPGAAGYSETDSMQFSGPRPSESSDLVLVGRSSQHDQSHARMPDARAV